MSPLEKIYEVYSAIAVSSSRVEAQSRSRFGINHMQPMSIEREDMTFKTGIKNGLKILLPVILIAIALMVIWQHNEYRKLRSVLLPESMAYRVPENLPPLAREAATQNRASYFTKPTKQQLDDWLSRIDVQRLTHAEDKQLAETALSSLLKQADQPAWMAFEEVEEELDVLLRYMQYGFALYSYRGGDAVFVPLFDAVKEEIYTSGSGNRIQTNTYIDILRKNLLPAAGDLHTYIGSMNDWEVFPEKLYYSYHNDTCFFELMTDGFYGEMDGKRYRLQSINGEAPRQYLKPGILEDGTIAWIPWLYTNLGDGNTIACTFLFQDENGQTLAQIIELNRVPEYIPDDAPLYSLLEADDYFYLRNSSLMSIQQNKALLDQMVSEAPRVRGKKPVIIDLRAHNGGNDFYAMYWLLSYLDISRLQGFFIPMPGVSYDLKTQTIQTLWKREAASPVAAPGLVSRYRDGGNPLHIRNDTPIFVMTDRGCGSSGEWFVSYLSRLDNVVVIGENTKGMTIGGNQCTAVLPISRYKVTFSTSVSVNSDLRDTEEVGLCPDLYAPPEEARERVVAMIKRYWF